MILSGNLQVLNRTLPDFPAGGSIGAAPVTVDILQQILVNQTTPGQVLTLPSPTTVIDGYIFNVLNVGSTPFIVLGQFIAPARSVDFHWNGSNWTLPAPVDDWPEVANFAALPAPAGIPSDQTYFNAETFRHYRYTGTVRRPVDDMRSTFNLADYATFQDAIDAAANYSLNSPTALLLGPMLATIQLDEATPAETGVTPQSVTIPGGAFIKFRGRDSYFGYTQLNITYTDTPLNTSGLVFENVRNSGIITANGRLDMIVVDGGTEGNINVGALYFESYNGKNTGDWTIGNLFGFFYVGGSFAGHIIVTSASFNPSIVVASSKWTSATTSPLFTINKTVAGGSCLFTGFEITLGPLLQVTGAALDRISILNLHQINAGGPSATLPFIDLFGANVLTIENCSLATSGAGFLKLGNFQSLNIQGNTLNNSGVVVGSTAVIQLTGTGLSGIISGNIRRTASAHFVDMPAGVAANMTMIGNRTAFSTALATNAPAISSSNI